MTIKLGCLGCWIIVHPTKDTLAWTGSGWAKHWDGIPIGDAQICNFDTREEVEDYVSKLPTVHLSRYTRTDFAALGMSSEATLPTPETAPLPPSAHPVHDFLLMYVVQFFVYCVCSVSFIAMVRFRYGWTFATDSALGLCNFFVIKRIAKSESRAAAIGYTLGGASGSMLAIWIAKHLFGS